MTTYLGTDGPDDPGDNTTDDKLYGLGGNDTLSFGTTFVVYVYGGEGYDSLDQLNNEAGYCHAYGEEGNDRIDGGDYFDELYGGGGSDYITGWDDNDYIEGGSNGDALFGESGADVIYGGDGDDSSVVSFDVGPSFSSVTGGLYGGDGADYIDGGRGNDTLDGGVDIDRLLGGDGNDTFIVDNAGDQVVEAVGGGTDRVFATLSYTLVAGQEIETLASTSSAGTGAINLTGNDLAQTIYGNAGANRLDGKGGADTLRGYNGNDIYLVDNAADQVIEVANGGTDDRVVASVSYALAAGQEIEVLGTTSAAGTGAINLTGNEKVQTVIGNAGANHLDGKAGADTLSGLGGNDTFQFSTSLSASTNVDTITDFRNASGNNDTIGLENAIFTKFTTTGTLNAAFFKANATGTAADSNDYVVYETDTGKLFYDADGSGSGARVQFATVKDHPALTNADVLVV